MEYLIMHMRFSPCQIHTRVNTSVLMPQSSETTASKTFTPTGGGKWNSVGTVMTVIIITLEPMYSLLLFIHLVYLTLEE